jgi:hypothetical protein
MVCSRLGPRLPPHPDCITGGVSCRCSLHNLVSLVEILDDCQVFHETNGGAGFGFF